MRWDDLKYFYETAKSGSFAEAGETLNVNPTTVSRNVTQLEQSLNIRLFDRSPSRCTLTPMGIKIFELASTIHQGIENVEIVARQEVEHLTGDISISSGGEFMRSFLAPIVWQFCRVQRDISVHLLSTYHTSQIDRHEADLAFRITDQPPEDAVAKKIADIAFGLYGSRLLIKETPIEKLPLICWGTSDVRHKPEWARQLGITNSSMHTLNDETLFFEAIRAGAGVGRLPCALGETDQRLVRLDAIDYSNTAPLWMVYHTDIRKTARLRAICTYLEDELRRKVDVLEGR